MCAGASWIDHVRVTSRLLRLLTRDDAVNVVVGNSTLAACPYLLPVSAITGRRLTASLLRLRPPTSQRYHLRSLRALDSLACILCVFRFRVCFTFALLYEYLHRTFTYVRFVFM